ncbi:MAG: S41 family peptidase, partial [Defluviitaleaceae bacterium]|nr:S41 family peptidase [Defluviitaleaceae bacterium]
MFKLRMRVSMLKVWMQMKWANHRQGLLAAMFIVPALAAGLWWMRPVIEQRVFDARENRRFNNLSREDFLYDFDYMIAVLYENFPLEQVIYDARGINIWEHAASMRERLADPEFVINDAHHFFDIMVEEFFDPMGRIGHLSFTNQQNFVWFFQNFSDGLTWFAYHRLGSRVRPQMPGWLEADFKLYMALPTQTFYREAFSILERSYDDYMFETSTLAEGSVAYVHFNHLLVQTWTPRGSIYRIRMHTWLESIKDYDHLIIDFRDNTGGFINVMHELVTSHITRFSLGNLTFHYYNRAERNLRQIQLNRDYRSAVASSVLNAHSFERRLHVHDRVAPINRGASFSGQVWLLIGEASASAAEAIAHFYKETGFATLVGENTSGVGWS